MTQGMSPGINRKRSAPSWLGVWARPASGVRTRLKQFGEYLRLSAQPAGAAGGDLSRKIIGICTALFLALATFDALGILRWEQALFWLGLSYTGVAREGRYYQFLTAPLIHVDAVHLAFNMFTLWMVGPRVEVGLGRGRYIALTFICALASTVGLFLCNLGTAVISCGYSGVIFGILVTLAVMFPDDVLLVYAIFPLRMKHAALLLGIIELFLTISPERGGVAHSAHLFGAAAALVYLGGLRVRAARIASQPRRPSFQGAARPAARPAQTIPNEL
jgi:membrane associated rhomboid family serine protease